MEIPSTITANNQGLIGIGVRLEGPLGRAIVPVGFERYGDLDLQELGIHLSNCLVLMGIDGAIVGRHDVLQMDDSP
jgi:hypothetical protein